MRDTAASLSLESLVGTLIYPLLQRLCETQHLPAGMRAGSLARALLRPLPSLRRRGPDGPVDRPPGSLLSYRVEGQAIDLFCENGRLQLEALAADLLRLRLLHPAGERPDEDRAPDPASSPAA